MPNQVDPVQKHPLPLLILLTLALLGYVLPWAVTSSAPMTLNAYDLAEWTSLHPAQRHTEPPLLAPLLLRAQLVILTLSLALAASGRWTTALVVLLLALAQLPPFEYVYDFANLNYRQQFGLALFSLSAGLVATRFGQRRLMRFLLIVLPILGLVSVYAGVSQAFEVYRQLQSAASVGVGPWLLAVSYVGIAAIGLLAVRRGKANVTN